MANLLHVQHMRRPMVEEARATLRAVARGLAAEHELALRAAARAASPHQRLAEVRAMYVPSADAHQEGDAVEPCDGGART